MTPETKLSLRVPGAALPYVVRGSGPLLLLIAGGSGGGAGFDGIAERLSDQFTVVQYDRRGFPTTQLDDPDQPVTVAMLADDAHLLLAALTSEPAFVFGTSAGAMVGLELLAHYPGQVRLLVDHEPPAAYLLADHSPEKQHLEQLKGDQDFSAFKDFVKRVGVTYDEMEPGVVVPKAAPENAEANAKSFFKYTASAVQNYRLDFDALKPLSDRIVVAGGRDGRDFVGYLGAAAVAQALGLTVAEFPSNHTGYISHPQAFTNRLREVLR